MSGEFERSGQSISRLENRRSAAKQKIEEEYSKGERGWIACFNYELIAISLIIEDIEKSGEMPKEQLKQLKQRYQRLEKKVHLYQLARISNPSDAEKKEMLDELIKID